MLQEKRGNTALARMKEHREKEFGSFIDAIESKYGGGKAKKQKKAKASHVSRAIWRTHSICSNRQDPLRALHDQRRGIDQ